MSQTVTILQIAQALGVSKRAAFARSQREGWTYEKRAVRGGWGHFFLVSALPAKVARKIQAFQALSAVKQAKADMPQTITIVMDGEVWEARRLS